MFDGILSMSLGTGSWNKRLDGLLSTDITISTTAVFPPVKKLLQVIKLPFPFLAVLRKYMIYECPSSDLSYILILTSKSVKNSAYPLCIVYG